MDTASTEASSESSPGAGSYSNPVDNPLTIDVPEEDPKFKDNEEEVLPDTDLKMLTIDESTLEKMPPHLSNLLQSFDINTALPVDLLLALIYAVALECSLAAVEEVQNNLPRLHQVSCLSTFHVKNVRALSKMPENIYCADKMTFNIKMQLIFDDAAFPCLLTAIVTGDLLILTVLPAGGAGNGKSICLSIGRYVLNSKGRPFPSRFRKLPELSFKLREFVLIPVRNHMMKRKGKRILYPGLDGLPDELYLHLFAYLKKNLMNIGLVSKCLQNNVRFYKKHLAARHKLKQNLFK